MASCRPLDRTRHHHVGEQKIDFSAVIDDRQRLGGVAHVKRPVTEALNLGNDVSAHQSIILNDQDGFNRLLRWAFAKG